MWIIVFVQNNSQRKLRSKRDSKQKLKILEEKKGRKQIKHYMALANGTGPTNMETGYPKFLPFGGNWLTSKAFTHPRIYGPVLGGAPDPPCGVGGGGVAFYS